MNEDQLTILRRTLVAEDEYSLEQLDDATYHGIAEEAYSILGHNFMEAMASLITGEKWSGEDCRRVGESDDDSLRKFIVRVEAEVETLPPSMRKDEA